MGFVDPPLVLTRARARRSAIEALNERGRVLLRAIAEALARPRRRGVDRHRRDGIDCAGQVRRPRQRFAEEERSRQPSVFSVLRALVELFASAGRRAPRAVRRVRLRPGVPVRADRAAAASAPDDQRDLVLYLPDEIAGRGPPCAQPRRAHRYEFEVGGRVDRTACRATAPPTPYRADAAASPRGSDHAPGEYAALGRARARRRSSAATCSRSCWARSSPSRCRAPPSELFRRLRERNPAPYGVADQPRRRRVPGRRVAGDVRAGRGRRADRDLPDLRHHRARRATRIDDAAQIRELLNSDKDETELTMCTDVDRNDKSRICVPGSVRVIGRRQIEMYSPADPHRRPRRGRAARRNSTRSTRS